MELGSVGIGVRGLLADGAVMLTEKQIKKLKTAAMVAAMAAVALLMAIMIRFIIITPVEQRVTRENSSYARIRYVCRNRCAVAVEKCIEQCSTSIPEK